MLHTLHTTCIPHTAYTLYTMCHLLYTILHIPRRADRSGGALEVSLPPLGPPCLHLCFSHGYHLLYPDLSCVHLCFSHGCHLLYPGLSCLRFFSSGGHLPRCMDLDWQFNPSPMLVAPFSASPAHYEDDQCGRGPF